MSAGFFLNQTINYMEILINAVNFKAGTTLEAFVREKVSKLFNLHNHIIQANVILRKVENGNLENRLCEIRLVIPGYDHFVKVSSDVYEKSILQAVKKLQKILRRSKTRLIAERNMN